MCHFHLAVTVKTTLKTVFTTIVKESLSLNKHGKLMHFHKMAGMSAFMLADAG
jgi:hypothetical protein